MSMQIIIYKLRWKFFHLNFSPFLDETERNLRRSLAARAEREQNRVANQETGTESVDARRWEWNGAAAREHSSFSASIRSEIARERNRFANVAIVRTVCTFPPRVSLYPFLSFPFLSFRFVVLELCLCWKLVVQGQEKEGDENGGWTAVAG